MVPARRQRELITQHGRGKTHTLRLVVPFKEKRNAGGSVTRKKARNTAGDYVFNVKIPSTFSANLAGENSRYMTQVIWVCISSSSSSSSARSACYGREERGVLPWTCSCSGCAQGTGRGGQRMYYRDGAAAYSRECTRTAVRSSAT